MTFKPCKPPMPFRILRPADYPQACAVYYRTEAARDAAAQRWADLLGGEILTELWAEDHPHDALNRGWGCDGVVKPRELITLDLHIENHYELYDMVVTTPTITVPVPPDQADAEAFDDWEQSYIEAATGTGRCRGNASYFVTVIASTRPELIAPGREFEFGV
jgi:hypothetical protein